MDQVSFDGRVEKKRLSGFPLLMDVSDSSSFGRTYTQCLPSGVSYMYSDVLPFCRVVSGAFVDVSFDLMTTSLGPSIVDALITVEATTTDLRCLLLSFDVLDAWLVDRITAGSKLLDFDEVGSTIFSLPVGSKLRVFCLELLSDFSLPDSSESRSFV